MYVIYRSETLQHRKQRTAPDIVSSLAQTHAQGLCKKRVVVNNPLISHVYHGGAPVGNDPDLEFEGETVSTIASQSK